MAAFRCSVCHGPVDDGRCLACGVFYAPRCPHCGNDFEFEQYEHGGMAMLRCGQCANDEDFEVVALVPRG